MFPYGGMVSAAPAWTAAGFVITSGMPSAGRPADRELMKTVTQVYASVPWDPI
jgi:hypothetical protein